MFAVGCFSAGDSTTFIFGETGNELDRLGGAALVEWLGDALLLVRPSQSIEAEEDHLSYVVYRSQLSADDRVREIPDVATSSLSPDGSMLAYYRSAGAPCAPDCATGLTILSIAEGQDESLGDLVPLMWTSDSRGLIVDSELRAQGALADPRLLEIETRDLTRIPGLRGVFQMWATERSESLIALTLGGPPMLSVVNLSTGLSSRIEGSSISFPSDHIPPNHVTSTADQIYWFDATGSTAAWYRANYDGAGLEKLGEAVSFFLQFSPSVSYVGYPTPPTFETESRRMVVYEQRMVVSTIDGSAKADLGASGFTTAWRPARD